LLGDFLSRGSRDFDPEFGEHGAGEHHESNVEKSVEGISDQVRKILGRRHVVGETSDGNRVAAHFNVLPLTEDSDQEVGSELSVKDLGDQVKVGNQSSLKNNGSV